MFERASSAGARFVFSTVIWKDLPSIRNPSEALTEAMAVPASLNPGARWTSPVAVPLPPSVVVTLAYVGPEAREKESPFRSEERRGGDGSEVRAHGAVEAGRVAGIGRRVRAAARTA